MRQVFLNVNNFFFKVTQTTKKLFSERKMGKFFRLKQFFTNKKNISEKKK
jgi:hypothetical protein